MKSNKKGEIIINITNIQRIISNNYEQLHANKIKNLEEIYIYKLLEIYHLPRRNIEEKESMNRLITRKANQ